MGTRQTEEQRRNPNRKQYQATAQAARLNKPNLAGIPARFAQLTPLELYRGFVPADLDYPGQICSGYVRKGWKLSLGLTGEFDFSFLLASFGIGQLQPTAAFNRTKTRYGLAVIQRWPQSLAFRPAQQPTGSTSSAAGDGAGRPGGEETWALDKPVSFLTLAGEWNGVGAELGVEFQWGVVLFTTPGPGLVKDGTSDTGVGPGATLKVSGEWETLLAFDPQPGWYESSSADALQGDFLNYLGPPDRRYLKREIYQWLKQLAQARINGLVLDGGRMNEAAKAAVKGLARTPTGNDWSAGLQTTGGLLSAVPVLSLLGPPFVQLGKWTDTPQRKALINALNTLRTTLENLLLNKDASGTELPARMQMPINDKRRATIESNISQARNYISILEAYDPAADEAAANGVEQQAQPQKQGRIGSTGSMKYVAPVLSFISMKTQKGAVDLRFGARFIMPLFAQVIVVGSQDSSISFNAEGRRSVSRFQSFAHTRNNQLMVATQDTLLTYGQARFAAGARAGFDAFFYGKSLDSQGTPLSGSANLILNTIDYSSVIIYWPYPESQSDTQARVCSGSGIRFGCSMLYEDLLRLTKEPKAKQNDGLRRGLMQTLRVGWPTLEQFLTAANIEKNAPAKRVAASIIIESAFAFPDGMQLPFKPKATKAPDVHRLESTLSAQPVLDFATTLGDLSNPTQPQTLRLRMRLADWRIQRAESELPPMALTRDQPALQKQRQRDAAAAAGDDQTFRLGLYIVGAIPNVISLQPIHEAGSETIIDLFTYHVAEGQLNKLDPAEKNRRATVPAVSLLHQ